jgi:hypothetical protein
MTNQAKYQLPRLTAIAAAVAAMMVCSQSQAFEFDTSDPGLKIRWDNTLKYSTIYRLENPDAAQLAGYTGSPAGDGDRNFKKGIASNRIDWLTEFDVVKNNNFGGRISANGWYDDVYQHSNDNTSGLSHNLSVGANQFNSETKKAVGNDLRLMDAFVFYKANLGEMPASIRVGRHAVIYGETLMSGANGIAAAQGPVDIVKAATVPGAQVKEMLLPTNQISMTLQPNSQISLGGYYQLKWEKSSFFPAGSFLSPNDVVGPGGQTMLDTLQVTRTGDLEPRNGGQWGAQLRYKPENSDVELGFYAANYHDKTPSAIYVNVGINPQLASFGLTPPASIAPATYTRVYQQDIRTYGVSASTVVGSDNVSIEASLRDNMSLTGGLCAPTNPAGCGYFVNTTTLLGGPAYDNKDNPLYAVGKTGHMTLVDIHIFQPNAVLKDGGSVALQYDWHTVNSVTKNASMIDPTTTRSASQITAAFSADWFQAFDGIDLAFPVVLSRSLSGRSRLYVGWIENGGSLDIGVTAKYLTKWKAGLNYHHFVGHHGGSIGNGSFDQTQFDRDYLSFNISTSF